MQLTRLEAAVILGIVIPQISSIVISSAPSDCLAAVNICMSDLCTSELASYGGICNNEGCQIKGSEVCNMTIQTILDQFPSLHGCVCDWKGELCDSIQVLATQCHRKTAAQQKRSTVTAWTPSSLSSSEYESAASCFEHMTICVSDTVCNKYLAPVLEACKPELCDHERCQQATQAFYGSMPLNVAERLAMCECEASDQSCLYMKAVLHSSTCEDETQICQDTVHRCLADSNCRDIFKTFQAKCWSFEEVLCNDSDLQSDECLASMEPALILGADPECKMAFLATLGTALHHPCSCKGVHNDDLKTCNAIHDVLHNRSYFMTSWKKSSPPSIPPEINNSEQDHSQSHDYLLYAFVIVLLVGAVLIPLAVVSTIWLLRKTDKTKLHHPQKSNCVVIL